MIGVSQALLKTSVDGSLPRPKETDSHFRIWSRSMVKSWIMNSVSKQIYFAIQWCIRRSIDFHITNLYSLISTGHSKQDLGTHFEDWDELDGGTYVCTGYTEEDWSKFLSWFEWVLSVAGSKKFLLWQKSIRMPENYQSGPECICFPSLSSGLSMLSTFKPKQNRPICSHCGMVSWYLLIHGYPIGQRNLFWINLLTLQRQLLQNQWLLSSRILLHQVHLLLSLNADLKHLRAFSQLL